jgi:hypothetical protein
MAWGAGNLISTQSCTSTQAANRACEMRATSTSASPFSRISDFQARGSDCSAASVSSAARASRNTLITHKHTASIATYSPGPTP